MKCEKIQQLLPLYIEGELNEAQSKEVEEELAVCDKCTEEFNSISRMVEKLNSLPQLEVPEDLHEKIVKSVKKEMEADKKVLNINSFKKRKGKSLKDFIINHRGIFSAVSTAACFILIMFLSNNIDYTSGSSDDSENGMNIYNGMNFSVAQGTAPEYSYRAQENEFFYYTDMETDMETNDTVSFSAAKTEKAAVSNSQQENKSNIKIIKTANISVEVKDFDYTIEVLKSSTEQAGGYVENFNSYISYKNTDKNIELKSGKMTLKVPSEYYDNIISAAGDLGKITQNDEYVENVTSQYVDTESMLKAKRAEEERLFAIMEKAETVEDLIKIEARLGEVRGDIEVYTNRLNNWDRLVKYSTININIEQKRDTVIEVVSPNFAQRIKEGFINSVNFIKEAAENVIIFVVWILPLAVILAIIAGIISLIFKFIKKKRK